jgi:hypothetical protein
MTRFLLIALMLASPPGPGEDTVVVQSGETLEGVAQRVLGDPGATAELRALNRLPEGGRLRAGERLRVPGPERDVAKTAIAHAEAAVAKPEVEPKAKQKALDVLAKAKSAVRAAHYGEALDQAREAIHIVDASKTKFSVTVAEDGATRVSVSEGAPVVVEARGQAVPLGAGNSVHVAPGLAPGTEQPLLPAPVTREPGDGAVLHTGYTEGLIGPLAFNWSEVSGAERYVVLVTHDVEGKDVVAQHEVVKGPLVTALAIGRYFWRVSARGADGLPGKWSPAVAITVEAPPPKLEVGSPTWR